MLTKFSTHKIVFDTNYLTRCSRARTLLIKLFHQILHLLWEVRGNSYFKGNTPVVPMCSKINSFHTL